MSSDWKPKKQKERIFAKEIRFFTAETVSSSLFSVFSRMSVKEINLGKPVCLKRRMPVNGFWILAALGVWAMMLLDTLWLQAAFALFLLLFFACRFQNRITLLLWSLLAVLSLVRNPPAAKPVQPEAGEYIAERVRDSYVIARNEKSGLRAVFYELDDPVWGQRLKAERFEPIHSLNNIGLFSFQRYMNAQKIYFQCSNAVQLAAPDSLRVRVFRYLSSLPAGRLYCRLFYGLEQTEQTEWMSSLGLPVLGLFFLIGRKLQRRLEQKPCALVMLLMQGIWLCLFPFSASLARLMLFGLGRILFPRWKHAWPFGVIAFCLLMPLHAADFSFVLPALLSFVVHFQKNAVHRRIAGWYVCSVLQIGYFSALNPLLLLGFSFGRTCMGWIALLSIALLFWQDAALILQNILFGCSLSLNSLAFTGYASAIVLLVLSAGILVSCFGLNRKKLCFLAAALLGYFCSFWFDPFYHVYMLDVGQGDCTVIVEPFKKSAVMIDAAGSLNRDNAGKILVPFLRSRRIDHLDALILTHQDFDHAGAADALCAAFPVSRVITERSQANGSDFGLSWPLSSLLAERPAEKDPAEKNTDAEDPNDGSVISHFSYDGFSYLWMGDASKKVEKQLLEQYNLHPDILKLGHHGSKTSSGESFLRTLSPELSLVSCGYKNRYGHPDLETLVNVKNAGSDILQTPVQGMVHLKSWNGWMIGECGDGTVFVLTAKKNDRSDLSKA